jgi:hypothetical protein
MDMEPAEATTQDLVLGRCQILISEKNNQVLEQCVMDLLYSPIA